MNSLNGPKIKNVLDLLHNESKKDFWKLNKFGVSRLIETCTGKKKDFSKDPKLKSNAFKDIYISIGEEEGKFLYLTAKSICAKNIIEFGTSFGISTIYLGAAVRDNGGGKIITTEIEPAKVNAARESIKQAGLDDIIEIRCGDAAKTLRESIKQAGLDDIIEIRCGDAAKTLQDIDLEIDMLFLDGWKKLYLPILKQLIPNLKTNSVKKLKD